MYMNWGCDVDLGIPVVDRDHRRLIDLFARVQSADWGSDAPELVRTTVDDLAHHVVHHFRHEELLMRLVGYTDLTHHLRSHRAITARLAEFQSLLRRAMFPHERFRVFLSEMMLSHLLDEDVELKPWVDRLADRIAA